MIRTKFPLEIGFYPDDPPFATAAERDDVIDAAAESRSTEKMTAGVGVELGSVGRLVDRRVPVGAAVPATGVIGAEGET